MLNPDPNFFHTESRLQGQKDSRIRIRLKNVKYLTPKIVSELSEIWSGMFIPDPDLDFLPIPDRGSRGQKETGSRFPDPQHWVILLPFLP